MIIALRKLSIKATKYLENTISLLSDGYKTIADIRQENIEQEQNIQQLQPLQTKEYARLYAIVPDLSYRVYPSDCINFASHILRAGGFDPNPDWHYDGNLYPMCMSIS